MMRLAVIAAAALALGFSACSKKSASDEAPARQPTLPVAEQLRGLNACTSYVSRLCECGKTQPTLKVECDKFSELPEELRLQIAAASSDIGRRDKAKIERSVRKIIKKCIEGDARLDPETCPRP